MTQYQQLMKKTTRTAVIAATVLAVLGGIYGGLDYYAGNVAQQKTDAASHYEQDVALLTTLRNQLEKSGEAQKRYAALQADRTSLNFGGNMEDLKEYLRNAKTRYRFDRVNFKPTKEANSDKPELANFSYNVLVQQHISVQFLAISDTHVWSFLDDLRRSAPGLIRIESVKLKRNGDLTDATISQIPGGTTPLLVDTTVEFTWIHFTPKEAKDQKNNPAGAANGAPSPATPAEPPH